MRWTTKATVGFGMAAVLLAGCSSSGTSSNPPASGSAPASTGSSVAPGTSPAGTAAPAGTAGTASTLATAGTVSPLYEAACAGTLTASSPGKVQDQALNEISGVVVSRKDPGVLWVHNDSGGKPEAYALAPNGELLGTYPIAGASAIDWEDIALGPGPAPGTDYLYLADIGDNDAKRPNVLVYRVVEPSVNGAEDNGTGKSLSPVDTITLTYPDGPHNAEALLVDPITGDLVIITKEVTPPAVVFNAPKAKLTNNATVVLDKTGVLTLGASPAGGLSSLVTGADISADGTMVAVRTYGDVWLYARASGETVGAALAGTPCDGKAAAEGQGEAVGIAPDGQSYYTIPEGAGAPINQVRAS